MFFAKGDDFIFGGCFTGLEHHGGIDRLPPAARAWATQAYGGAEQAEKALRLLTNYGVFALWTQNVGPADAEPTILEIANAGALWLACLQLLVRELCDERADTRSVVKVAQEAGYLRGAVERYKARNEAQTAIASGFDAAAKALEGVLTPIGIDLLEASKEATPAFDAFRTAAVYFSDFRQGALQQFDSISIVTLDRIGQTTTVLWNSGRTPTSFPLNAISSQALLVTEQGNLETISATNDQYTIELPPAPCINGDYCFIGGAPRLVVESGASSQRVALQAPDGVVAVQPEPAKNSRRVLDVQPGRNHAHRAPSRLRLRQRHQVLAQVPVYLRPQRACGVFGLV